MRSPERRLAELRGRGYNYDPARLDAYDWRVDDFMQPLPGEPPGPPVPGGSFETARRLMLGYEFADPSIVHAHYDPDEPLEGRTMLLEIRFRGLLRVHVGTRVSSVYEEQRDGAHVWGWAYRTLAGHLEQGQMDWQVWKWPESGDVEFRIHAYSRRAPDRNLVLRLGFRLLGRREQLAFLHSTLRRMERLTAAALDGAPVDAHAEALTARRGFDTAQAHERLARRAGR
ncbi:MAG TPA: DUF1990 family protein [Solirubrobacteraceae bacterium]|jgi:hypothetical protein